MNTFDFETTCQHLQARIDTLLKEKADEYAEDEPDGDRLYNFKQATSLLETNPARVAFAYCTKHYASLAKITADMDKGFYPTREYIEEKVGDIIAYSFLIYAIILEELNERGYYDSALPEDNETSGRVEVHNDFDGN